MTLLTKSFSLSLLCILAAVLVVGALVDISNNTLPSKSVFKRNFIAKSLVPLYHSEKVKRVRTICGLQNNHIYFETDTAGIIIETDATLSNARLIKLAFPNSELIQSLFTTFIDSRFYYIMAGNVPEVIQINIHNKSYQAFHFPQNLYSLSIVTGNNDYVVRAYQKLSGKWDQIFIKWNPVKNTIVTENNVSEKRGDAGFSTDGNLLFDKSTHRIIYVGYYSNQFICMDTSLGVLYKGHTIDTFSRITTKPFLNKSPNFQTITNGSPLLQINLESRALNGKLYIHSAVQAKNEIRKEFINNSVIDIYQISDGHYSGSIYIPEFLGEGLKDFNLYADKIIVLYNSYVVVYSLPFSV